MTPGALRRLLPLALLLGVGAALLASGAGRWLSFEALAENEGAMRAFIADNMPAAIAAFILIYALATAISLPGGTVLTLAGGLLFGPWIGGAATVIGATMGAIAVFFVVRTALGETLKKKAEASGGRLAAMMAGFSTGAFGYILTLRLIPLAPFWLVNVACGIAHAPFRAYAVATLLGIMPATFIYSGIGAGIGEIIAKGQTPDLGTIFEPHLLIPLLLLGALTLAVTVFQRRRSALEKRDA
jgi:uncharacterized membrane protein YdjX (TVP38/TMEM64 family)